MLYFFISLQLNATTLDFRHEYSDSSRINKDRIAFIHSFSNGIGFYIDASIKSGGVDGEKIKYLVMLLIMPSKWG